MNNGHLQELETLSNPIHNANGSVSIVNGNCGNRHELMLSTPATKGEELKFVSLNVCGLNSKVDCPDFCEIVQENDFILLSETKLDDVDIANLELPEGYKGFFKNRNVCSAYRSGGISIIFKAIFSDMVQYIESPCKYVLWCRIDKKLTGWEKDILLGSIYVPPESSRYFSKGAIEDIQIEVIDKRINYDAYILLGGDFNARTAGLSDLLVVNKFDLENGMAPPPRIPSDKITRSYKDGSTNNSGFELIELCKTTDMIIINGRFDNGDTTFKSLSTIDYFICSIDIFHCIQSFRVSLFNPVLSDGHNAIHLCLEKYHKTVNNGVNDLNDTLDASAHNNGHETESEKVKWSAEKRHDFMNQLCNLEVNALHEKVDVFINDPQSLRKDDVSLMVNDLSEILVNCAKECGMTMKSTGKNKKKVKAKKANKWFDQECSTMRKEFNVAKRKYRESKTEENLAEYRRVGKTYKKTINATKYQYRNQQTSEIKRLESDDPKKFWKLLNNMQADKGNPSPNIDVADFFQHFKDLNEALDDNAEEYNLDVGVVETAVLNKPISEDEVRKQIKLLRNGKAAGTDQILNEMIKCSSPQVCSLYTKLFNLILDTGHIPEIWSVGVIKPIYKNKGRSDDPDNYRGITLVSCLGKLYTGILNSRLSSFIESNNKITECQAGFRKGYSTVDHIFTLKALIDIYLSSGRRLFSCFVDYKKAFDSVWRVGLWQKLLEQGINGKILNSIINLYKNTKSCVSYNGKCSEYFITKVGVKQGENLSPLLFALFLNDMEEFFDRNGGKNLHLMSKLCENANHIYDEVFTLINLFTLLYADDTIIFAESEADLQRNLDVLFEFCRVNRLKVNETKTKIMVFTKSKARLKNVVNFTYGGSILDRVEEYCYLGVIFQWNGKFSMAKKAAHDKATRAMYSIIQKGRKFNLPIPIMFKLFDACVLPILLYGAEVWGFENTELVERVHTKFCKLVLRTSKFTYNSMIYGETGRTPIGLVAKIRMLNYWCRLVTDKSTKINVILYKILFHLHVTEKFTSDWILCIKNILENTGFNYIWLEQNTQNPSLLSHHVKQILKDQYEQDWYAKLCNNDEFISYRIFKRSIEFEEYLSSLPEYLRQALTEFRLGSNQLPVNFYGNKNTPRNERYCNKCDLIKAGDEFHMLFECQFLNELRQEYIPTFYRNNSNHVKMSQLLNNKRHLPVLAKFICKAFKLLKTNPP